MDEEGQFLQPDRSEYVTMHTWPDHRGRPDLVDFVADEFERRVQAHEMGMLTANYA
jgi:hypothetical protein